MVMGFKWRSKRFATCLVGWILSILLLSTGLPMRNTKPIGQAMTISFLALNPPFIGVLYIAPYEEHELEHSNWPQWKYPTALFVSLLWWCSVFYGLQWCSKRSVKNKGIK
jgi:hypothetical protein